MPEHGQGQQTTFRQRLDALVGKPIGSGGPTVAPDPVNQPMIRHWAAAFEDGNPVYTDPDARGGVALRRDRRAAADAADLDDGDAEDHRHGRARRLAGRGRRRRGARPARRGGLRRHARVELRVRDRALPAARRRRVGDDACSSRSRRRSRPASGPATSSPGSPRTPTRAGEVVGRQTFRILKFRVRRSTRRELARLAPSMTPDTQFFWDGVQGAPAADPALRRVRRAAPSAAADVPALPLARVGHDRVVGARAVVYSFVMPRHPPFPWFEEPLRRRARRARGGHAARDQPRAASHRTTRRSACRSRCASRSSTTALVLPLFRPWRSMTSVAPRRSTGTVQVGDELPAMVIDVTPTRRRRGRDRVAATSCRCTTTATTRTRRARPTSS